jgi:serine/threonine protein kinase
MKHIGRYRLDAVQGVGAFATVWRGWDEELEAPVAVKVLADNWSHNADVRERFLEEARILRRIVDPRVVRVHDVGIEDDRPYFVMDFIAGGTVADLIGNVDLPGALAIAGESARAVQALHDHDVLHRDVKPSNLLIDQGRVVVSDLGSAKRLAEATGITVTTGTPAYMAPEQAYGQALDARCDVYALGVIAYELLTGRAPFASPLGRKATDRPLPSGAGPAVDRVLTAALATKPSDRPSSARVLADLLAAAASSVQPGTLSVRLVGLVAFVGFAVAAVLAWYLAN